MSLPRRGFVWLCLLAAPCSCLAGKWSLAEEPAAAEAAQAATAPAATAEKIPRIALICTVYYYNTHAEIIAGRILESDTLDGKGVYPKLKLVSLYADQTPEKDTSREAAAEHGFRISETVADALTLGTGELAVDGVLLIAEHGDYPESAVGQTVYPKRRLFTEIAAVFEKAGRAVPVFSDKHLADNWEDAKWFYDTAVRLHVPLMAGSSLPVTWRKPEIDMPSGAKIKELVAINYGGLDPYGFHAMEMVQSLVERRAGGETGVKAVQANEKEAVWEAGRAGVYDTELLEMALEKQVSPLRRKNKTLQELVPHPVLFAIEYSDGLRVNVLTLQGSVADWCSAWRYEDGKTESVAFLPQEERPYFHFALQMQGIEQMMHTGQPAWNAQRTLMTSGLLYTGHLSLKEGSKRIETPYLQFAYEQPWTWKPPQPMPPDQPRPPRPPKAKKP